MAYEFPGAKRNTYTETVCRKRKVKCGIKNVDCQVGNGEDYSGETSQTASGLTCQAWNVQTPHRHNFGRLGAHNHCRNPDGEPGAWCYTTSPDKRYELCNVRQCSACDKGNYSWQIILIIKMYCRTSRRNNNETTTTNNINRR